MNELEQGNMKGSCYVQRLINELFDKIDMDGTFLTDRQVESLSIAKSKLDKLLEGYIDDRNIWESDEIENY